MKLRKLPVHEGRIMCPVHGDTDVDVCAGCRWLEGVDDAADGLRVACAPPRPMAFSELVAARFF